MNLDTKQDVFETYKQAVNRFHKACHTFREADNERNQAEKALHEISQAVEELLKRNVADPTIVPDVQPLQMPGASVGTSYSSRR